MTTTYTLTEGNDALNRVLLMMRYELGKTLDENAILEQPDEKFDTPYNKELMKKYQKRIEAPTLSEALLELREFFYSPIGATTQVVLSIVGVEIGVPLVFQILDGAIIANDAYIMVRDWDSNGPKISYEAGPMGDIHIKGLWEWFEFHFKNNIGFQYLCVDVLAVLAGFGVMGLGKIATKSVKSIFKLLIEKLGKNFPGKIAEFLSKFKPETNIMPKKLGTWVDRKMSEVNKAIELLKTPKKAAKSVLHPVKLTLGGAMGVGTYKLMKWFETKSEDISNFFNDNPEKQQASVNIDFTKPDDKILVDAIKKDNSDIFDNNFKVNSFKIIFIKKNNKLYTNYYLINNVKYIPIDLPNTFKVKKK